MTDLNITTINFHGSNIIAIAGDNPSLTLVAMKPIVEGIGLDWGAQHKKITKHPVIETCVSVKEMQLKGDTQSREHSFISLDMLNFWLATIHPDRIKNTDTRAKIIAYQTECARVLFNHFFGKTQKQEAETLTEKVVGGIVKRGVHKQLETVVAGLALMSERMQQIEKALNKPRKSLKHGGDHRIENAAKSAVAALTSIQLDSVKKDWAIEATELLHQSEMLHDLAMERLDNACVYMRVEDRNHEPNLRYGDIIGYRQVNGFVYDGYYVLKILKRDVIYQCQYVGNGQVRAISCNKTHVLNDDTFEETLRLDEFKKHVRGIIVMRCNIMDEKALMGAPLRTLNYKQGPQQALAI